MAVNATLVPEQLVFPGFAVMLTLAVTVGVTVMMIGLEVAGLPVTQLAWEVITHRMVSLFDNVDVV